MHLLGDGTHNGIQNCKRGPAFLSKTGKAVAESWDGLHLMVLLLLFLALGTSVLDVCLALI